MRLKVACLKVEKFQPHFSTLQNYCFFLTYANFHAFFCTFSTFRHPLGKTHKMS